MCSLDVEYIVLSDKMMLLESWKKLILKNYIILLHFPSISVPPHFLCAIPSPVLCFRSRTRNSPPDKKIAQLKRLISTLFNPTPSRRRRRSCPLRPRSAGLHRLHRMKFVTLQLHRRCTCLLREPSTSYRRRPFPRIALRRNWQAAPVSLTTFRLRG